MNRLRLPGSSISDSGMSHFWVPIQLAPRRGPRSQPLLALVDTGSTYTWIASDLLEKFGVTPVEERPFLLADGREALYRIGWVDIRLDGRDHPSIVVFAPPGSEPILGVVTLEVFGLAADPVNERLIRVPARAKQSLSSTA